METEGLWLHRDVSGLCQATFIRQLCWLSFTYSGNLIQRVARCRALFACQKD